MYPPPCHRHAGRLALTPSTLQLEILPESQTSFWKSNLRLEILPEIQLHLSENLTDSYEN